MTNSSVSVIVDAQAGSSGKGKLAAYLALRYQPDVAVANFGPNAGHTVWLNGQRIVFRHLPSSCVYHGCKLVMSAGALIDLHVLHEEIRTVEKLGIPIRERLFIHPRCAIIEDSDKEREAEDVHRIASTMKGVGASAARKLRRIESVRLAQDVVELADYVDRWGEHDWLSTGIQHHGWKVLLETSQGFDLDINHGLSYPYCTSRQVSAVQALADAGLPAFLLNQVYGIVRPFPIRVGNVDQRPGKPTNDGWSGPYWRDNTETGWHKIAKDAGMDDFRTAAMLRAEITTVTGRQRRVFTFSHERLRHFVRMVGPTSLVLAFADQIDAAAYNMGEADGPQLPQRVLDFVHMLDNTSVPVRFVSTGPEVTQMVDLGAD